MRSSTRRVSRSGWVAALATCDRSVGLVTQAGSASSRAGHGKSGAQDGAVDQRADGARVVVVARDHSRRFCRFASGPNRSVLGKIAGFYRDQRFARGVFEQRLQAVHERAATRAHVQNALVAKEADGAGFVG